MIRKFHDFIIKEKLGSGGQANVYLATQENSSQDIALKILNKEKIIKNLQFSSPQERRQLYADIVSRFVQEYIMMNSFGHHPYIVAAHALVTDYEVPYFTMDYIENGSLDKLMNKEIRKEAELSLEQKINIIYTVASALSYIHANDTIHRDIKPGNILIDTNYNGHIADLGMGKELESSLTKVKIKLGTWNYLAPESFDKNDYFSQQTDIYALGITMYSLLTMNLPHRIKKGEDPHKFSERIRKDPAPTFKDLNINNIPKNIEEICFKALAKDPSQRYKKAKQILKELEPYKKSTNTSKAPTLNKTLSNDLVPKKLIPRTVFDKQFSVALTFQRGSTYKIIEYGELVKVKSKNTELKYTIKRTRVNNDNQNELLENIQLFNNNNCPYIPYIQDIIFDKNNAYLFLEGDLNLFDPSDLLTYTQSNNMISNFLESYIHSIIYLEEHHRVHKALSENSFFVNNTTNKFYLTHFEDISKNDSTQKNYFKKYYLKFLRKLVKNYTTKNFLTASLSGYSSQLTTYEKIKKLSKDINSIGHSKELLKYTSSLQEREQPQEPFKLSNILSLLIGAIFCTVATISTMYSYKKHEKQHVSQIIMESMELKNQLTNFKNSAPSSDFSFPFLNTLAKTDVKITTRTELINLEKNIISHKLFEQKKEKYISIFYTILLDKYSKYHNYYLSELKNTKEANIISKQIEETLERALKHNSIISNSNTINSLIESCKSVNFDPIEMIIKEVRKKHNTTHPYAIALQEIEYIENNMYNKNLIIDPHVNNTLDIIFSSKESSSYHLHRYLFNKLNYTRAKYYYTLSKRNFAKYIKQTGKSEKFIGFLHERDTIPIARFLKQYIPAFFTENGFIYKPISISRNDAVMKNFHMIMHQSPDLNNFFATDNNLRYLWETNKSLEFAREFNDYAIYGFTRKDKIFEYKKNNLPFIIDCYLLKSILDNNPPQIYQDFYDKYFSSVDRIENILDYSHPHAVEALRRFSLFDKNFIHPKDDFSKSFRVQKPIYPFQGSDVQSIRNTRSTFKKKLHTILESKTVPKIFEIVESSHDYLEAWKHNYKGKNIGKGKYDLLIFFKIRDQNQKRITATNIVNYMILDINDKRKKVELKDLKNRFSSNHLSKEYIAMNKTLAEYVPFLKSDVFDFNQQLVSFISNYQFLRSQKISTIISLKNNSSDYNLLLQYKQKLNRDNTFYTFENNTKLMYALYEDQVKKFAKIAPTANSKELFNMYFSLYTITFDSRRKSKITNHGEKYTKAYQDIWMFDKIPSELYGSTILKPIFDYVIDEGSIILYSGIINKIYTSAVNQNITKHQANDLINFYEQMKSSKYSKKLIKLPLEETVKKLKQQHDID